MNIDSNQDELGLFDDWQPAVWSNHMVAEDSKDEQAETNNNNYPQDVTDIEVIHSATITKTSDSPFTNSIRNIFNNWNLAKRPSSSQCTGNAIVRVSHDDMLDKLSGSMDELQDLGLTVPTNASANTGMAGNSNNAMGISAPRTYSNLHEEQGIDNSMYNKSRWSLRHSPHSHISQRRHSTPAFTSQERMNRKIDEDRDAMHNNFELLNLP